MFRVTDNDEKGATVFHIGLGDHDEASEWRVKKRRLDVASIGFSGAVGFAE